MSSQKTSVNLIVFSYTCLLSVPNALTCAVPSGWLMRRKSLFRLRHGPPTPPAEHAAPPLTCTLAVCRSLSAQEKEHLRQKLLSMIGQEDAKVFPLTCSSSGYWCRAFHTNWKSGDTRGLLFFCIGGASNTDCKPYAI